MVVVLEDLVDGGQVDRRERAVRRVRDGPAGPAQGRFLAPLAVGLGRAPVDVVAALRVDAAHVDALDRAGLGALEARLALERAPLVVEQLQAAAELVRDVGRTSGYMTVTFGSKNRRRVRRHALDDAEAREEAHRGPHAARRRRSPPAVTNRLSSDAGSSHFQAKPISWSMRTRGSVPRIQTKVKTKT